MNMKSKIIGALGLVFIILVVCILVFIKGDEDGEANSQENYVEEPAFEYNETYHNLEYSKNEVTIGLDVLDSEESKIFIEKIMDEHLDPKYILQTGNELYFVTTVDTEERKGTAIYLYDVIDRKLFGVYFHPAEEFQKEGGALVLKAIDTVHNKLIVMFDSEDSDCTSLWLRGQGHIFSIDLYTSERPKLVPYVVPEWKIEEEQEKSQKCFE